MASFLLYCPTTNLASSSSIVGLKLKALNSSSPGRSVRAVAMPRALAPNKEREERDSDMRRRAVLFAAFATVFATASSVDHALAEGEAKKKNKRNKCPTICVQMPTASCCYGY